jgi:hypothetical protein
MRQYEPYVHGLFLKLDFRNQPVLVTADVEDDTAPNQISVRIVDAQFSDVLPRRSLRPPIPVIQRFSPLRLDPDKFDESFAADHVHALIVLILGTACQGRAGGIK